MVPDFGVVHPDGRSWLLEIVGSWRPTYLRKKSAQGRRAGQADVILAVSERLNLEPAGECPLLLVTRTIAKSRFGSSQMWTRFF
jgi:predicted nuclease of restriction endonuclease-like RecB superfamily